MLGYLRCLVRAASSAAALAAGLIGCSPSVSVPHPHWLRIADGNGDLLTLNPHLSMSATMDFVAHLSMGYLIRYDRWARAVPDLATEIPTRRNGGVSADGRRITWHLRRGVRWSDGAPFDARDVAFSIRAVLNPANNEAQGTEGWNLLARVDTPDRYTVVYHLKRPYGAIVPLSFATVGGEPCLLPQHLLAQLPDINHAAFNALPVGLGPFRVVEWKRGDSVELEANPYFWRGRPRLDRITFKFISSRETLLVQLRSGDVDLWPLVPPTYVPQLSTIKGITVSNSPSLRTTHLDFLMTPDALADRAVRRAVRYALDRARIVRTVEHGEGFVTDNIVWPYAPVDRDDPRLIAADPARARRELSADGWIAGGDGIRVSAGAPGSATVFTKVQASQAITRTPAFPALLSRQPLASSRRAATRTVHVGPQQLITVSGPTGCLANGKYSFIGENGYVTSTDPVSNFAGGAVSFGAYAGVAAGLANAACDQFSFIGAGSGNAIGGDNSSPNSVIGGGSNIGIELGPSAFLGAGDGNVIGGALPYESENDSAIVSGSANTLDSPQSFIGAGSDNTIAGESVDSNGHGQAAFIGSGYNNAVFGNFADIVAGTGNSAGAGYSTVVGGTSNTTSFTATYSVIGGGSKNDVGSTRSLIGGGQSNTISPNGSVGGSDGAAYSVIAGGSSNTIRALVTNGASYGFIGGGSGNTLSAFNGVLAGGGSNIASGDYSTVPGGLTNKAEGVASFAAGRGSQALDNGTFVWSDDSSAPKVLKSTAVNQFLARSAGGFYLYTSANLTSGVRLASGSGSWSSLSDRAAKTGVKDVDDRRILAKVASLPVSQWSYTAQGTGIRHLGPMAQDFRAAFGLGEDDKHISAVDEEGVALAAIKALQAEVAAKDRKLADLDAKYARLEQRVDALAAAH